MSRSTFKFHIDLETDDGYFRGKSIDLQSNLPEIMTFDVQRSDYDRKKWEDFIVYDLKQELGHYLDKYIVDAVKGFLDEAEKVNTSKSKAKKRK